MNHQVEDDVDVEAALGKPAQPMDLDEPRRREERQRRRDRRVEPLGVADRRASRPTLRAAAIIASASASDAPSASRPARAMPRSRNGRATVEMIHGRHRDRHRVDAAEQRRGSRSAPRRPCRATAALARARSTGRRRATRSHARQRRQKPRVMPAEMADADDRRRAAGVTGVALMPARPTTTMPASFGGVERTRRRRASASCRRRSTSASRRRPASPRSSRRRRPARRTACPASAWRP